MRGVEGQWLRWYDATGDWIPTDGERADRAEAIATSEAQARRKAIPRWSALGLAAAQIAEALGLAVTELEG